MRTYRRSWHYRDYVSLWGMMLESRAEGETGTAGSSGSGYNVRNSPPK